MNMKDGAQEQKAASIPSGDEMDCVKGHGTTEAQGGKCIEANERSVTNTSRNEGVTKRDSQLAPAMIGREQSQQVSKSLPRASEAAAPLVSPPPLITTKEDARQISEKESEAERVVTNHSLPSPQEENCIDKKRHSHEVRLSPATRPPDAPALVLPRGDEEQGGIPPMTNAEQGTMGGCQPDTTLAGDNASAKDEVFSAYLPVTAEERRRQAFANAVSATNVHVVERSQHQQKRNKWIQAFVVLSIVIGAAVGISLGMTLSRRDQPSAAPVPEETQVPTSARFGEVVALVESISNTTSLLDPSTPQYQAAQWLANEDELLGDLDNVDPERFRQRYVMVLFYFATGGPTSWIETFFFLKPDVHECEWRDKGLPNTQSWSGYVGVFSCTADQWVEGIEIDQNNLTGNLPDELGSLSSLSDLTVFGNSIGGTLPTSLFMLSNLWALTLTSNKFTGAIPTDAGQATSLQLLFLETNSFTGMIPSEIGNLSGLEQLLLNDNFLNGSIPTTLLQLSNITYLSFTNNSLTGTLPPSLWSSLSNLRGFAVLSNQLSGTIPNNLDSVPHLEVLSLRSNNFTGPFPSSIVKLTNVTTFDIAGNAFTGSLPSDWANLSSTLDWLEVSGNRLTGTLPESLGSLTKLYGLSLFFNGFNGTIPASLGNLTELQLLQIGFDSLTGTVPASYARLSSLRLLMFVGSELTGDLSFLCNGTEMLFPYMNNFGADCYGENAEVICPCCNTCCSIHGTCYERHGNDWVIGTGL